MLRELFAVLMILSFFIILVAALPLIGKLEGMIDDLNEANPLDLLRGVKQCVCGEAYIKMPDKPDACYRLFGSELVNVSCGGDFD